MSNETPETLARRVRLSSIAIMTAIALTVAALIATMITSRDAAPTAVKTFGPVTKIPVGVDSGIVPVIDR
jgi:hypothetical protein